MLDTKIISFKEHRINFKYNNKHYSIQECWNDDDNHPYVMLRCKENQKFYENIKEWRYIPSISIKKGQTYKNTDFSEVFNVIEKYLINE